MEDLLRRTLGEQVRLEIELARRLWPALTDANQLENALLNLAINARDAMPHGGASDDRPRRTTLTATRAGGTEEIEPGDYTVICVTDTGVGMSPRDRWPRSSIRSSRPSRSARAPASVCRWSMASPSSRAAMSGSTARSAKGTTVRLYLPRHQGAVDDEGRGHVVPPMPRQGAGETVLLVEDDPSVRLLIAEVLRELGYASHRGRRRPGGAADADLEHVGST